MQRRREQKRNPHLLQACYNAVRRQRDLHSKRFHHVGGFKSRSSKGGGTSNCNEIRFEDKKGSEEVYVHAEKNLTTVVENDESLTVTKGNRTAEVQKGNETIKVSLGDREVDVPLGTYTLKARKIVIEATEEFSLKCSLGTFDINPAGLVSLNSPLVKINS